MSKMCLDELLPPQIIQEKGCRVRNPRAESYDPQHLATIIL